MLSTLPAPGGLDPYKLKGLDYMYVGRPGRVEPQGELIHPYYFKN